MCTDGVHCQESPGKGPVVLKVLFAGHDEPINVRLSFPTPHPLDYWYKVCMSKVSVIYRCTDNAKNLLPYFVNSDKSALRRELSDGR